MDYADFQCLQDAYSQQVYLLTRHRSVLICETKRYGIVI